MSYPLLLSMTPFQNPNLSNTLVNIIPRHEAFDDSIDMVKIIPLSEENIFNEVKFNIDSDNSNKYFQNINTYIDHPNIPRPNIQINKPTPNKPKKSIPVKKEDNNNQKWDMITQIYMGSITVVGLFVIFRMLQKSK